MRLSAQTPCWRTPCCLLKDDGPSPQRNAHSPAPTPSRCSLCAISNDARRLMRRWWRSLASLRRDTTVAPVSIPGGSATDPLTKVGHRFVHLTGTHSGFPRLPFVQMERVND